MHFLQVAAAADTLLVRNVPPTRTAFESIAFVASGLNSIIALILVVLALAALLVLRKKANELREKIEELLREMRPMTWNVNAMSDDVREVAKNVNGMVNDSRETVRVANERIRTSVVSLTDRVDDLSAILSRVNDSAERVATVASTTMAGIKFGARALGLTKKKGPKVDRRRGGRRGDGADREDGPRERPRLRRRD